MTPEEIATVVAERDALLRATVGASNGLTPDQAARLRGTTQEELEADAAALTAAFAPVVEAAPSPLLQHGTTVPGVGAGGEMADGAARYRAKFGEPAEDATAERQTQTRTGYTLEGSR